MTDFNIALPPVTAPSIVNAMRGVQPLPPFDEHAALQRMQRVTFLRIIHERGPVADPALRAEWQAHQARVAQYSAVKSPKPPATLAPLPAASVPRSPRPPAPQPSQAVAPSAPTPALDGVSRRVQMFQRLVDPPQHPDLI
jgi:hypothetical protein